MKIEELTDKKSCRSMIIKSMLESYSLVVKNSHLPLGKEPQDFIDLLTCDFFRDEDHYLVLKMSAYFGDIVVNLSDAEGRLLDYMLLVANKNNIGVFQVYYTFLEEHLHYSSRDGTCSSEDYAPLNKIVHELWEDFF